MYQMELDPRKLLVLHAVVRHDGVQGAAVALRVSPSAVSQQLASLERQAGVALLDRSTRKLRLTPAGESLIAAAEIIDNALEDAAAQLSRRQVAIEGTVTIGSLQSLIISRIAPALQVIQKQHPLVAVRVHEVQDTLIVRQVRSGELDVGLIEARLHAPLPKGLAEIPIANDAWQVVVPRSWAKQTTKQLVKRPWISTFDDARSDAFEALTTALGTRPTIAHRCVEFPSVLALVAAEAGAAIVPQLAIDLFGSTGVAVISVPGLGARTLTLVHRTARHEPTVAVKAIMDALIN
jgi:DNA-binding transcriptional LysR family regulator